MFCRILNSFLKYRIKVKLVPILIELLIKIIGFNEVRFKNKLTCCGFVCPFGPAITIKAGLSNVLIDFSDCRIQSNLNSLNLIHVISPAF